MATYTPVDKYQARISWEIGRFRTWAGANTKLHIGEFNMSQQYSGTEQLQFIQAGAFGMARMSKENIHFSAWAGGQAWGNYNLLISDGSTVTELNQIYSPHYTRNGLFGGINWAGAEFGHTDTIENPTLQQWGYPSQAQLNYMKSLGITCIRQTMRWERVATSIGGALRSSEVTAITNTLNYAQNAGIKVILDVHNYALIHTNSGDKTLDDTTTRNGWFDLIDRLYDQFGSHPAFYAVDTMNEPSQVSWQNWETYSQDMVTYIRNQGHTGRIIVELGNWAGIQELGYKHPSGPWITDPADNLMYSGHFYPDYTNQNRGNYTTPTYVTYQGEVNASPISIAQGTFTWDGTTTGDFGSETNPDPIYYKNENRSAWIKGYSEYVPPSDVTIGNESSAESSYTNSLTFAHDSNSDFLLLTVATRYADQISTVTYNGVAMTKIGQASGTTAGIVLYYLINPTSGSNNIQVNYMQPNYNTIQAHAVSVIGIDVDNPIHSYLEGIANYSTSDVKTLTDVPEGAIVFSGINLKTNQALTPDVGQTEIHDYSYTFNTNMGQLGVSYYVTSGIEDVSMGWSWSSTDNDHQMLVALNPSSSQLEQGTGNRPAIIIGQDTEGYERSSIITGVTSGGGGEWVFGNEATKLYEAGSTSDSFSYSVDGASDMLIVAIGLRKTANDAMDWAQLKYNGVAFTEGAKFVHTDNTSGAAIYYLLNPATGANNLSWTASPTSIQMSMYIFDVSGVDTADAVFGVVEPVAVYGTSHTGTINSVPADSLVVSAFGIQDDNSITVDGTQTQLANITNTGGSCGQLGVGYVIPTSTANTTVSASWTGSCVADMCAIAFNVSAGATVETPDVETGSATLITDTTVTLAGNILATGGASITERGICYGTSANPTTAGTKVSDSGTYSTGGFSKDVTGLTSGQLYHYRAYAINSAGTSYGSDQTFTTIELAVSPIVERPISRPKKKKRYTLKVFEKDGTTFKTVLPLLSVVGFQLRVNGGLGSLEVKIPERFGEEDISLLDGIELWVQDSVSAGRKIYSGYINSIESDLRLGAEDKTIFALGYVSRLAYTLDWNGTTLTQARNSQDPTTSAKDVIDDYRTNVTNEQINYATGSTTLAGFNVSLTSNTDMCSETLDRLRQMAGEDYYWYVDADNVFYFKPYSTTADHIFTLGKDIANIKKSTSFSSVTNRLTFWNSEENSGSGDYIQKLYYSATAVSAYWDKFDKLTDSRITDSATADKLGTAFIEANKEPNVSLVLELIDDEEEGGYNIESVRPGETCKIINTEDEDLYGSVLRITGVDYLGTSAFVYVQDKRSLTSRNLNDIRRKLDNTVYSNNPGTVTLDDVD